MPETRTRPPPPVPTQPRVNPFTPAECRHSLTPLALAPSVSPDPWREKEIVPPFLGEPTSFSRLPRTSVRSGKRCLRFREPAVTITQEASLGGPDTWKDLRCGAHTANVDNNINFTRVIKCSLIKKCERFSVHKTFQGGVIW